MLEIKVMTTKEELERCFPVFQELRPHIQSAEEFIVKVKLLQDQEQYAVIAAIINNQIVACCGFRIMHMLWAGKMIYIDDLVTASVARKSGAGGALLDYVFEYAKEQGCAQVHLDSGHQRTDAHRLYLNKKFNILAHHFVASLDK